MKKFELTYNPFTHERTFIAEGHPATLSSCWGEDDSGELSEWCCDFFKELKNKFNDSEIEVRFKGILRDWEFLLDAKEKYCEENPSDRISLVNDGCVNTSAKLGELCKLFEEMQSNSPFPELKTPELKGLFDKATSSEFEMAVVATMSSGKSTLINSMLGSELLPARNEATTATLAKIHDIDGMTGFKGTSYDANHEELASCNPLTLENMNMLNDNPKTSVIEIYGDIVGVESKDIKLVLTDTPGPNNSRTEEHKEHTYKLVEADYKPMILYVLNGTQLETKDDNSLLKDIADNMRSGGRQSQERFIFVLNKADEFDPGKGESAQKKVEDVKQYLERHGIKNAHVFPAAARMAKVIRQHLNNQPLTETEEDDILPKYQSFIKREWKHFSDLAPLSPNARRELDAMLADAQNSDDKYREALIYTGVPAIELAISEYLAKYALPAKITEGVFSFKSKIDSLGVEARETEKLKNNKTEVEKLKGELNSIESLINNGEKAKELRDKIERFSAQKNISERLERVRSACQKPIIDFMTKNSDDEVSVGTAKKRIKTQCEILQKAEVKFKVDVEKALNVTLREQVEAAVKEYKTHLESLVGKVSIKSPDAILGTSASISVDESLDSFTNEVVVGYRRREQDGIFGSMKRGLGSLFFQDDWGYDEVAEYGERVDFASYLEKKVKPKVEKFFIETSKMAKELAKEKEQEFKDFYKKKLVELDAALKRKVAERKKALQSQESVERMIEENERNLAWLNDFKGKLDKLLSV
jgi:GTPase SAR1 family protein